MSTLGVISDTHGLLRPEAVAALAGCELIIHAGDVGSPHILPRLQNIAPVFAVRGNVDGDSWCRTLPERQYVEWAGHKFYVLHNLEELDLDPIAAGVRAVVTGHSHVPLQEEKRGVLYLNPGSAGPRRFRLPICLARVTSVADRLDVEMRILSGKD